MLDGAARLLQHDISQCRVIRGRSPIGNREIPARHIAGEEDGNVVDARWIIGGIRWKSELSIVCDVEGDMQCVFRS